MKKPKTQQTIISATSIFIMLLIIIFINLISLYIFTRIDFTRGGIYSISKASKKLIRKLTDRVIINAYFSKNLPLEYADNRKYLEDLLSEYRAYSHGKIKFKFIDPSTNKDLLNEVRSLNIPPIQFTQIEKDKYEVKEGFMGISFIYGDRSAVIPVVKGKEGLEYDISSKIKKLVSTGIKTIGLVSGHKETSLPTQLSETIGTQYNIQNIELLKTSIGPEVSALFVIGPKEKFNDLELSVIEQFILSGKPVIFLIDTFDVDIQSFWARKLDIGLDNFFSNYGVKVLPGFVLDWQNSRVAVRTQRGFFSIENIIDYPLFPVSTNLSKKNPIVKDRDSIGFGFVSPIEVTQRDDIQIEVLAKSSPKSWYRDDLYFVSPFNNVIPQKQDKKGPFNLAIVINSKPGKKYKNYYTTISTYVTNPVYETNKLGRILIIGSSKFINRDPDLFLNIIDWSTQDEDLISIRAKESDLPPLRQIPYGLRLLYKYTCIFLVPILLIIYGFLRWRYRQAIRKSYSITYG